MSKSSPKFFTTGNSRLVGRETIAKGWQQTLGEVDQAILSIPNVKFHTHDVIFEIHSDGLFLYREIIGFIPKSSASDLKLFLKDKNSGLTCDFELDNSSDAPLEDVISSAKECVRGLESIEIPSNYGTMQSFIVRQRNEFLGNDEVQRSWRLEVSFANGRSSIFAF